MRKIVLLLGLASFGAVAASSFHLLRQPLRMPTLEVIVGVVLLITFALMQPATPAQLTDAQKIARRGRRQAMLALAGASVAAGCAFLLATSHAADWVKIMGLSMLGIGALGLLVVAGLVLFRKPASAQATPQGTQAGVGPGGGTPPQVAGTTFVQRLGPFALLVAVIEAFVIVGLLSGASGHHNHGVAKKPPVVDPCRPEVRAACERNAVTNVAAALRGELGELCESPPGGSLLVPCKAACKPPNGHGTEDCRKVSP